MAQIFHMMGPTCAGKSTLITQLATYSNVGVVEIGKLLRAKYGPAYFQGQAAPQKTAAEALEMYIVTIVSHVAAGKELIFVDGQPRDLDQAKFMMNAWPNHQVRYILVNASHEVREERARRGREPGPDLELAVARLTNDYKNNYTVMAELLLNDRKIEVVNTDDPSHSATAFCKHLLGGS